NERLNYAFQLAVARPPTEHERQRLTEYFDQQKQLLAKDAKAAENMQPFHLQGVDPLDAAAWVGVSRVLLNLDEFITRE
ncbi:MAG TPA: hypothetical protein VKT81_05945, partial [Bryobacteraceae bacterium]|nr:hypothetical protein [Bryobacteraceae bacterium]